MAHELSIRQDGFVEMAFTGRRDAIWHSLGNELEADAPISKWKTQAGMDWTAEESNVSFIAGIDDPTKKFKTFPKRKVLYRSDTLEPLSIVGSGFNVVQPGEVLEFFKDLVGEHGMTLSTAGCLFGGRRFWALAETGNSTEVVTGDVVKSFILLTTALDGTLATTAKTVATRVVCNNTLTVAMGEAVGRQSRVSHRNVFDPRAVMLDMKLIDTAWDAFMKNIKKMADTPMTVATADEFFRESFFNHEFDAEHQPQTNINRVKSLNQKFITGVGSEFHAETVWGALNAITEEFTHGSGRRSASSQFCESLLGQSDAIKNRAYRNLLELV